MFPPFLPPPVKNSIAEMMSLSSFSVKEETISVFLEFLFNLLSLEFVLLPPSPECIQWQPKSVYSVAANFVFSGSSGSFSGSNQKPQIPDAQSAFCVLPQSKCQWSSLNIEQNNNPQIFSKARCKFIPHICHPRRQCKNGKVRGICFQIECKRDPCVIL